MFNLFGELKLSQSMKKVKHNSIGVGLNCSQVLANSLGGDVILLNSQPGAFAIQVVIPIKKVSLGLKSNPSSY